MSRVAEKSSPSQDGHSLLPVVLAADKYPYPPTHHVHFPSEAASASTSASTSARASALTDSSDFVPEQYTPLYMTLEDYMSDPEPVGLLRPCVLEEILRQRDDDEEGRSPWTVLHNAHQDGDDVGMEEENDTLSLEVQCVFLADWVLKQGPEGVGRALQSVVEQWRDEGKFSEPLGGWRNELYTVYTSPRSSIFKTPAFSRSSLSKSFSNAAFGLERSACAVFGFATFGVHMTAYEGEGESMRIWVPRRSKTKATWPGMLDQSVAGGIPHGMSPMESLVKECDEEASLPETLVRERARNVGVTTYFYVTNDGYLQPEIEYLYDLQLPPPDSPDYVRPRPHDDEVESFALLSIPQVIAALHSGEFKPNCGLVLVDFLIRHGFVTPESEPNYLEIAWRMRRRLGVSVPM